VYERLPIKPFPIIPFGARAKLGYIEVDDSKGRHFVTYDNREVTVVDKQVKVKVGVQNSGSERGRIYIQLIVNGNPLEQKSATVKPGSAHEFGWTVDLQEGSNTVIVKVGH